MSRWRRRRLPLLAPPVLTLAPRQRQRLQRQSRSGRRTWCRFFGPQLAAVVVLYQLCGAE